MKPSTPTLYTDIKSYLDACRLLKRPSYMKFLHRYLVPHIRAYYKLRVIAEALSRSFCEPAINRYAVSFTLSGNRVKTSIWQLNPTDTATPFTFPNEVIARYFENNFAHLMRSALIL